MNKDFVEVANDSGSNNGSFDVVCGQNGGNERSTILTVSGGEVNKTINITQKASNLESIEIAGPIYYSDGSLATIRNFGIIADIRVSVVNPQIVNFIFPTPIIEMTPTAVGNYRNTFLRIEVSEEIPSHYKGEKVVAFLETVAGNTIYTPKKDLTVDVYRMLNKNVFDLNIADGITLNNTEIIDINSALNNRPNIVILLTNNKKIQFINFIWKAIYHDN
jgi:hypothetical protein